VQLILEILAFLPYKYQNNRINGMVNRKGLKKGIRQTLASSSNIYENFGKIILKPQ